MTQKKKLAIIGSGVAGLGAAYTLRDNFHITIYEKNNYPGGHTNTIATDDGPVDTGFIVFNKITYPNLIRLFSDLDVDYRESDMSFSSYFINKNIQWAGTNTNSFFAQRRRIFQPRWYKFLREIMRFNRTAPEHLAAGQAELPLHEYLAANQYSRYFRENYLYPMSSAVWSTPMEKMDNFPTATLIRFFLNHGFLGIDTHYQWYYVQGGSKSYVGKILAALPEAVRLNEPVEYVAPAPDGGAVVRSAGGEAHYDAVIIATHADQALNLRKAAPQGPSSLEKTYLSPFKYEHNRALLHTDESIMPPLKRIWSAWNYKLREHQGTYEAATVYWMNPLQKLAADKNYFVSINEFEPVNQSKIIREIAYEHPLFDRATEEAQKEMDCLNEQGPIFYCGSYFRYGFHEDAFRSGLLTAKAVGKVFQLEKVAAAGVH